jgi:hypothetical protein
MTISTLLRRLSSLSLIAGLLVAYRPLATAQTNKSAPAITYIAAAAKLEGHPTGPGPNDKSTYTVTVNGVTNLPKDSDLYVQVYDYIGQGSHTFSDGQHVTVGPTGEFTATILPKSGFVLRANLLVDVGFMPDWNQPASVVAKVGRRGEKLNGPQLSGNSGGALLEALTVVTE